MLANLVDLYIKLNSFNNAKSYGFLWLIAIIWNFLWAFTMDFYYHL